MPRTLLKVFPDLFKKKILSFSVIQVTHKAIHFPCFSWRTAECSGYNVTCSPLTSFFKEVRECLHNLEAITLLRESDFPQQRHGCPSHSWSYLSSPSAPGRWTVPQIPASVPLGGSRMSLLESVQGDLQRFLQERNIDKDFGIQLWNIFKVKRLFLFFFLFPRLLFFFILHQVKQGRNTGLCLCFVTFYTMTKVPAFMSAC